ncbi:MAG: WD40/YVTN/BNR-like repeat-containing protein [Sulfobacillus sp.]
MRLGPATRSSLIAALLLALAGCGQPSLATTANSGPHLAFVAPPTGTTLHSPTLTVRFSLTNFRLVSARSGDAADSGQIELFVDGNPQPPLTSPSDTVQLEDGPNQLRAVLIRNGKPLPGTTVTERLNASLPFVTTTQQFQMLSASWGWKGGQLPNGNLWVASTSDGGRTWTNLPVPAVDLPLLVGAGGVFFLNPSDGWIIAPVGVGGSTPGRIVIYRTTSGGRSWAANSFPVPSWAAPAYVGDPLFVTPLDGWFTIEVAATAQGITAMYRTTDGGRSWSTISVGSTLGTSGGLPAPTLHALPPLDGGPTVALSPSVAFTTGAPFPNPTPLDFYRTRNGGVTWQSVSISLPVTVEVSSLAGTQTLPPVFSGPDGSVVLTLAGNSGLSTDAVYTTVDNGQSWQFSGFAPATAANDGEPLVSFESPDTGIALGPTGLFQTTDGGRNWTRLRPSWLPGLMHNLSNVIQVQVVGNSLFVLVRGPDMANGAVGTVESYPLSPRSATP